MIINNIKTYFIALIIFLIIDVFWLTIIAKNLYQKEIGYIMSDKPNFIAAGLFYLVFMAGLVFFVINPAIQKDSWSYALFAGMFFGLVTYATYDLTNLATLAKWPLKVTIIDLIWGSGIGGTVSILTFFVLKILKIYK